MFAKQRLEQAGASPEALSTSITHSIDLPTFGAPVPHPPPGIEESRDMSLCHPDLQRRYAAFKADYKAETGRDLVETCTWRSKDKQFEYFKCGRELKNGIWVIVDKWAVKTYLDGYTKKSRHNVFPSEAVDVAIDMDPGPGKHLSWDRSAYAPFAKLALKHHLIWGGDWNGNMKTEDERFVDMPHLEVA